MHAKRDNSGAIFRMQRTVLIAFAALAMLSLSWPALSLPARSGDVQRPPSVPAPASPSADIQINPAVRQGVLANGLRYAVRSNPRPVSGLSIRLEIRAGSMEEGEGIRGAAHFLEHMAFNGSENFGEAELQRRFAEAGVAFGRDQNAYTTGFRTVYKVDFTQSSEDRARLGLRWLRDITDELVLSPEAVERERGVILSEYRGRLGPGFDWSTRYLDFIQPDLRSTARPPIGVPETLASISAEDLRAFYRDWYRPGFAILAIAGDQPVEDLERLVVSTFSDWQPQPGPDPVRAALGMPDTTRGLSILASDAPGLSPGLGLCYVKAWTPRGADSVARRQFFRERAVWREIVNRRLRRLTVQEDSGVLVASFANRSRYLEAQEECLNIEVRDGAWESAMAAVIREVRLFERDGVTPGELEQVVAAQRASLTASVASEADRYSASIADTLLSEQSDERGDPSSMTTAAEDLRLFELVIANIDADAVLSSFRDSWSGSGPFVAITLPDDLPDETGVKAAFEGAMTAALPVPAAAVSRAEWSYRDFGPPGAIATRTEMADPAFVRLVFENGVVVNFKSVDFTSDRIDVGVRFGFGLGDVADEDYGRATLGVAMLQGMGLGRHSYLELTDIFNGARVSANLTMGPEAFVLSGTTRAADFERQLEYLTAELSDPGFRSDFVPSMRSIFQTLYRSIDTNPWLVLGDVMTQAIAPASPRSRPPLSEVLAWSVEDFARPLRPILESSPLEVTVVGDVPEERAIEVLSRTLGALPARAAREAFHPDPYLVRYPVEPIADLRATHTGDPQQAVVAMIWPLWMGLPERRAEQRQLDLLTRILGERIRVRIREELGLSYAPSTTFNLTDFGDQGTLSVGILAGASDADQVRQALDALHQQIMVNPITEEERDQVLTPILARVESDRRSNSWWYNALAGSARDPRILRDSLEWPDAYRAITVGQLNDAAGRWLNRPPIVAIISPRAPAP